MNLMWVTFLSFYNFYFYFHHLTRHPSQSRNSATIFTSIPSPTLAPSYLHTLFKKINATMMMTHTSALRLSFPPLSLSLSLSLSHCLHLTFAHSLLRLSLSVLCLRSKSSFLFKYKVCIQGHSVLRARRFRSRFWFKFWNKNKFI